MLLCIVSVSGICCCALPVSAGFVVVHCQCHLGSQGATDLVIDLIISNHSSRIFQEAIELAIALLDGGNSVIQVRLIYGILCGIPGLS